MLCGCVNYPTYPPGWASLEYARPDCLSINGVYSNSGEWSRFRGSGSFLAWRLLRDTSPADLEFFSKDTTLDKGVDRVQIAVSQEGKLEITALDRDRVVKRKEFLASKDDYRCDDGRIEIAEFIVGLTGARQESVILLKSTDGALIVKDGAAGLMLFVLPIAGNDWHRFKAYPSGDPGAQPARKDAVVDCVAGGEQRRADQSKCD